MGSSTRCLNCADCNNNNKLTVTNVLKSYIIYVQKRKNVYALIVIKQRLAKGMFRLGTKRCASCNNNHKV